VSAPSSFDYITSETHFAYVGSQAEAMYGHEWPAFSRLRIRAELAAGATVITQITHSAELGLSALGLHGGIRFAAAGSLFNGLGIEAIAGYDAFWQSPVRQGRSPLGFDQLQELPYLAVGLRLAQ
jgi:hypothetical protein